MLTFRGTLNSNKEKKRKMNDLKADLKLSDGMCSLLCLPSAAQGQAKGVNIQCSPDSSQSTCSLSVQMDHASTITEWSIFPVR